MKNHFEGGPGTKTDNNSWIHFHILTHGFELGHEFFFRPFLRVGAAGQSRGSQHFAVVGERDVQVVYQNDVRVLQEPVAAPVESGKNGRMHITSVDTLEYHETIILIGELEFHSLRLPRKKQRSETRKTL